MLYFQSSKKVAFSLGFLSNFFSHTNQPSFFVKILLNLSLLNKKYALIRESFHSFMPFEINKPQTEIVGRQIILESICLAVG